MTGDGSRVFDGLDHRARGRLGEAEAEKWLRRAGYRIVERNFTCRGGEIDLVAREGEVLCFVEIKARANDTFGKAIEAISSAKKRRIVRAASLYLARNPVDCPCRFDVLAMDLLDGRWQFTLVRDAFAAN